jgi:hypothetical protein
MPIIVACPKCATRLSAPDNAAGKQVRCPKPTCGGIADVPNYLPAEEVAVVEAVAIPPKSKPKPKPVPAVADDDDDRPRKRRRDENDDDRPRSRRRLRDDDDDFDRPRRRRSGANPMAVAALVLGGLVLVAGIGVGVYFLVSHKNGDNSARGNTKGAGSGSTDSGSTDSGPKAPVPAGWVQHTAAKSKFRIYLPKPPSSTKTSSLNGVTTDLVRSGGPRERLAATVMGMFIPPDTPGVNRGLLSEHMRQGILQMQGAFRVVSQRSVTWAGRPATEMTLESSNKAARAVMRHVTTANGIYYAFFACSTGPSPDEEKGYFDNFEVLE